MIPWTYVIPATCAVAAAMFVFLNFIVDMPHRNTHYSNGNIRGGFAIQSNETLSNRENSEGDDDQDTDNDIGHDRQDNINIKSKAAYGNEKKYVDNRPFRESKPGDRCIVCYQEMTVDTMHKMPCGHAVCQAPCYTDYPKWRRDCPYCERIAPRIDIPGDNCPFCLEPMHLGTIQYLRCHHAMHGQCLTRFKAINVEHCLLCGTKL